METLLKKIAAIAAVNEEIIDRIRRKKEVKQYLYTVNPTISPDGLRLALVPKEEVVVTDASYIVNKYCPTIQLIQVPDVFNDKISYALTSFADLARLNTSLMPVVAKYELFGNSEKANKELEKYKTNFELLQTALGQLEEQLQDGVSRLREVKEAVGAANSKITDVAKVPGVYFGSHVPGMSTICTPAQLATIRKWIDVNGTLELAFRSPTDQLPSLRQKFASCGSFLFLVKTATGQIFGGYGEHNPASNQQEQLHVYPMGLQFGRAESSNVSPVIFSLTPEASHWRAGQQYHWPATTCNDSCFSFCGEITIQWQGISAAQGNILNTGRFDYSQSAVPSIHGRARRCPLPQEFVVAELEMFKANKS